MSKYQYRQSDIYLPGTELPVNRLGIEDAVLLHEIEARLLEQAYATFVTELTFDLIAMANGYGPIDYGTALRDDPEVGNSYIRASIDCVRRADHRLLLELVSSGLCPMDDSESSR
ncbi:MAG: hypothetical protein ABT02_07550 [Comamonadaceae bacterium SCN 68-20]|nr:hypothetical protein [Comamonadaceae bacterium]ODU60111.1 MAG: hypothetical protein ABT02_07550 [Comamonadaceae bacterium SCN 68-20]OJX05414.1 MAG: hypothetical protein BGO75_15395 [Burkholderiales bacterium 68-20]